MEALTLKVVAEATMDAFYRQLVSEDDFFDLDDFTLYTSFSYAALLQDEYEQAYNRSRSEGMGSIASAYINPDWFQEFRLKVEDTNGEYVATFDRKPFTFRFDRSFCSIMDPVPTQGTDCRDFIRSSHLRKWMHNSRVMPKTGKVYWYPQGNKLIFENVQCGLREVMVHYIPSIAGLEEDCLIPETLADAIMRRTVSLMKELDKTTVVDKTADGNPNKVDASELNPAFQKGKT